MTKSEAKPAIAATASRPEQLVQIIFLASSPNSHRPCTLAGIRLGRSSGRAAIGGLDLRRRFC